MSAALKNAINSLVTEHGTAAVLDAVASVIGEHSLWACAARDAAEWATMRRLLEAAATIADMLDARDDADAAKLLTAAPIFRAADTE